MFKAKDKSNQNGKTAKSSDSSAKRPRSLLHIFADERSHWLSVLDQVAPQDIPQAQKTSVLLAWIEHQLQAAQSSPEADELGGEESISVEPVSAPTDTTGAALPVIDNLASGIAFLTAELQAAKTQITALEHQRDQSKAEATSYQQQLTQLQQNNAQLQAELIQFHQAQVQLEPLLKLLQGAQAAPTPSPAIPQFIAQQTTPAAIATAPAPAISQAAAQSMPQPAAIASAAAAPRRGRRAEETEAKVNGIIDAILAYNNSPGLTHTDKWAISFPVVKELGKPIGATYQKIIQQVFQARGAEIEAHHQNHGLGSRHNRGKDLSQLTQLIQL